MDFIQLCDEDDIGGVAAHVVALKTVSTCGTSGPNMLKESGGQMLQADCILTTIRNPNQVAQTCSGEDAVAYDLKNCSCFQ